MNTRGATVKRRLIHAGLAMATLAAIAVVAGLLWIWSMQVRGSTEQEAGEPMTIDWLPVARSDHYTVERRYLGRVEARRRSAVGFELAGKVVRVAVDEGESVEAGRPIAALDTERLEAARAERVAAKEEADARRALARLTLDRLGDLEPSGAASAQAVDDARKELDARAAAVRRIERAIDRIDVDLGKSELAAPFDAIVSQRHVDEGAVIASGAPIVTLLERSQAEARIGVPQSVARALDVGSSVMLELEGEAVDGEVLRRLPTQDGRTRTVDVIFALDREMSEAVEGALVVYVHDRRVESDGFWLPVGALVEGRRGLWSCYVARPVGSGEGASAPRMSLGNEVYELERRTVELLHQAGDRAFVRGAVEDGAVVLASGRHRVTPGLTVRLAERGVDEQPTGAASRRSSEGSGG